jgi:hypothetical protein
MLVAVQSFGSIWTARDASAGVDGAKPARRRAYYNTTGVLAGSTLRHRCCLYGYVRVDECSGFHPRFAERFIHRVLRVGRGVGLERPEQTLSPAIDAGRYAP